MSNTSDGTYDNDVPQVTVTHIRELLDDPRRNQPVLYVAEDEDDGTLSLDTWVEPYVYVHHIVTTRQDVIDFLGEDATNDDIREFLPSYQEAVDRIAARITDAD